MKNLNCWKNLKLLICSIVGMFLCTPLAFANLHLELTQGMSGAIPIAVVPFAGQNSMPDSAPDNIGAVIHNDLQNSGQFQVLANSNITSSPSSAAEVNLEEWQKKNINDLVIGNVQSMGGDRYKVSFNLLSVFQGKDGGSQAKENNVLLTKEFVVSSREFRTVAHKISNMIFEQLTGVRGIFLTKIAYVLVQKQSDQSEKHTLEIADADGYNPTPVLMSNFPIMSPAWSADGRKIAYVAFTNDQSYIYIQDIQGGSRFQLSGYPGINGAPAWSPNGNQLAIALSKSGAEKIYLIDVNSRQLTQLTDGTSIDTEPRFSPDGKSIIFTSNRSGGPQIYKLDLATRKSERMTFDGNYNATASFTPDGQQLALLHAESQVYNIALQDVGSGALIKLTSQGGNSHPSISPNGKMVIYANNNGNQGTLGIVSTNGKIQLQLPAPEGSVQEPSWGPFR